MQHFPCVALKCYFSQEDIISPSRATPVKSLTKIYPGEWVGLWFPVLQCNKPNTPVSSWWLAQPAGLQCQGSLYTHLQNAAGKAHTPPIHSQLSQLKVAAVQLYSSLNAEKQ